jgi:diguanylate cyclase (GGDEF)-like protein
MDSLADLPRGEDFAALLVREELRRGRTDEVLSIAVLDVDGLRTVNALLGASAGTEVLRVCAGALRATARTVDVIARTGADEFSVLLHATDARSANAWADRFELAVDSAAAEHPAAPITCALGLADTTEEPSLMEVAARARRRMEVIQTVRKLRRAREGG